jgi:hypothetical protein
VSFSGQKLSAAGSRITATIDIGNGAPVGQTTPSEVFGPDHPGGVAGEYQGLVTLYLPQNSFLNSSKSDPAVTAGPSIGSQNSVAAVTYTITIPAGGHSQVVLDLTIPPTPAGINHFYVVPTARVIPTVYRQELLR